MGRFLSVCLFSLFCLVGCQKSTPVEKNIVRMNLSFEPVSLDPRKARDLTSCTLIHMLYEGLTRTARDGKTELALADKVDLSDDGLRYVFHLRDSKWTNGDLVTASDFAESWKMILDPQFPSDIANQLFAIKNGRSVKRGDLPIDQLGIEVLDEKTLAVELEAPIPYFLELISMTSFFPIHRDGSVTNGPFTLQEWKRGDSLNFVKNPDYWEASDVKLEGVEACLASSDTGIRMFQEGKLDWTGSPLSTISIDAIRDLKTRGALRVKPFSGTSFLRVNVTQSPYSSVLFRQALAAAIERKPIAEHLMQGGQLEATALTPPEMGLSQQGYFEDGDLLSARSLMQGALREMGVQLTDLKPVVLSFINRDRNMALVQTIQKQWEETLGIKVELEAVEPKVYFQRVSNKEFELALGNWTADFNDPINFLEVFKYKESGSNNTGWENQRFIDLLNESSVCKRREERMRCLNAAEKILMDQMPIIPIYHFALNFLVQDKLKDVALSPIGGLDFRWAYWER